MSAVEANIDHVTCARRRTRMVRLWCTATCLTSAAWAVWPVRMLRLDGPATKAPVTAETPAPVAILPLNLAAFDAPVWLVPRALEPPPIAGNPPPPPPPLKLQLLGVSVQSSADGPIYRAVLYDPDIDAICVAAAGEVVAGRRVTRVTASDVTLALGAVEQILALRPDQPPLPLHPGGTP